MEQFNPEIESELIAALKEFNELIISMNETQLNTPPSKGSWTAGQLARHVIKVNSSFLKQLKGPFKETNRKHDEQVENIKNILLNFNTKLSSPDPVVPEIINYKKEDLLNQLIDLNNEFMQSVKSSDMTKTCLLFEIRLFGYLTRLEVVYFVLYHTERHIHQLKNIIKCIETN
jgi:hypothetical protein